MNFYLLFILLLLLILLLTIGFEWILHFKSMSSYPGVYSSIDWYGMRTSSNTGTWKCIRMHTLTVVKLSRVLCRR